LAKRKQFKKNRTKPSNKISVKGFLEWLDEEFQARQNNPNPPYPYNRDTNTIKLPKEIEEELMDFLRNSHKVEAVKQVTILTGAGLRISKDYVDDLLTKL
jgi:ribosomal protein L7/L12